MSVPVLMYHHVLSKDGFIAISRENFEKQIYYISKHYRSLSLNEFEQYKKGELKLNKKSVLITFDDGWRDNLEYAYPILKFYNVKAVLFLVTGWADKASKQIYNFKEYTHNECKEIIKKRPNEVFLSWEQVEKMQDVFDIQSHTHYHRDDYFGKITLEEELVLSKEKLEKHLNKKIKHLCWPRGKYSKEDMELAKKIGYEFLYTTKRGVNSADKKLDEIKRISVKKDDRWLKKQLFIFSHNILGNLYSKVKN